MHDKSQIYAIYIFCFDKSKYEQWTTEKWPKVRGIFANIDSICDSLRQTARECDDDDMKITGQIEPSFMYSMLFKEIVLEIHFDLEKEIPGLAKYARQVYKDKPEQLPIIDEFVQQYNGNINNSPVRWYTAECFTYKMLNKALGRLDAATLLKTGFFMRDLHQNIEELHEKQINDNNAPFPKTVYRGKIMTQEDFKNKIQQGKLISYNNFLSTTEKRDVAIDFIGREFQPSDTLPPNHPHLATSYNNIGGVHKNIGDYSKALEFYEKALKIREKSLPSNHPDLGTSYNNIGQVCNNMGDYSIALEFYEKALKIKEKALPPNHPSLAGSHLNFAVCYERMGDYASALKALQNALQIQQKAFQECNPAFTSTYSWFGRVYRSMKDYSKALGYFEKCLAIDLKTLAEGHPYQAITYSNIGDVYRLMGNYEKALAFHQKALDIQENVHCNPLQCAATYTNLGETYRKMQDYSTALSYFQKGLEIREKKLPKSHPDLAVIYHNMAKLYLSTGQYNMAMKNVQQAIEIAQEKLHSTHPHLLEYKETFEKIRKEM
ncbi:unnamed protein product [Rotaria sp. Silwood1]|nr:unnamed protein product [Rotaria sp. Silwood1]